MTAEEFAAMERRARMFEAANEKMLTDNKRLREENARLQGLLREAHVKMEANNLWSNLRHRVAAAIREGGDD